MKKPSKVNPFTNLILDEEEKLLEQALEKGEFEPDPNLEETKLMLREAAARYTALNTAKPITLRINQLDLIKVKAKAKRYQIPYQTLLGALIHEYVEGERDLNF